MTGRDRTAAATGHGATIPAFGVNDAGMPSPPAAGSADDLFRCQRQHAVLRRDGCGRLWLSAQRQRPETWQSRWHCRLCPVGAMNAGQADKARITAPVAAGVCPRCRRPTDRLINGRFCISCYNRHREAQRGRNAKGSAPRLCALLHGETVAFRDGPSYRVVDIADVADRLEAIILAFRKASGPVALCRARPAFPGQQLELPL